MSAIPEPLSEPSFSPPGMITPQDPRLVAMPGQIADTKLTRRRPSVPGAPGAPRHSFRPQPPQRVPAGLGVAGSSGEVPAFLRGPDETTAQLRATADEVRTSLVEVIQFLQQQLPHAARLLAQLEEAHEGAKIASAEGLEVQPARALLNKLLNALEGV